MKVGLPLVALLCAAALVAGGKKGDAATSTTQGGVTELNVWSFTDEMEGFKKDFEERNPDVKIKLTIVPSADYLAKLRPAMRTRNNAPDVFTAEVSFVKEVVESGFWDDLRSAPYNADTSDIVDYVLDVGSDHNGVLRAISWQATVGGFYYRRSLAKKYLGTDDPQKVGEMISSMDKFIDTGRKVRDESGGQVFLLPGVQSLLQFAYARRQQPWVVDNKLVIDPEVERIFDVAKLMRDENLEGKTDQWTPAWFNGIKKDGKFLFYILPTWGLHYVLKPNGADSAGDWGLTTGPATYFWGGTWIGVNKNSSKKETAWRFVKMLTLDPEYSEEYAKKSGDFVSNVKVVNKIKDGFSEPFLNGQNHYALFAEELKHVKGRLITRYDQAIGTLAATDVIRSYASGQISKAEAMKQLKQRAHTAFPDLVVE